jgi:hypothetical protein
MNRLASFATSILVASLFASACAGHATVVAEPAPPPPRPAPAPAPPPPPPPAPAPVQVVVVEQAPALAHPAYLHAMSDLRYARALLAKPARPDVKWDEQNAIKEIDAALKEIREAAIDDSKAMEDHPPIDVALKHRDRLKQAEELLRKAAADIDEKEQNEWAKGLRGRANGHIHNAEHAVHEAIDDRKENKKHGR